MGMPVVQIRRVRVGMSQRAVRVRVRVPFQDRVAAGMVVMVAVFMRVQMLVELGDMVVRVRVLFAEQQRDGRDK